MAAYTEHRVMAGGCDTRYVEAGTGEPLLLLHSVDPGGSGTLEYRENIAALSRHFRVIVPDLMGFGGSSLPDHPITNTSDAYTAHIVAFMDVLGLDKVHLAGNSRGGLISVAILAAHPARVGRVVLIANAGGGVTKEYFERQKAANANFKPTREQVRAVLARSYYSLDRDMAPEVFEEYAANAVTQYARYDAFGGLPADVPDLRPELSRTTVPILYIFGTDDNLWPPVHDGLDVFLATPGARYYITSQCGHHPQTEKPAEINLLMTAFLTGAMDS